MLESRRFGHQKFGFALSAEQQLTGDLGGFARISMNDGRTEDYMFTQIDQSAALGLSLSGNSWSRPDDVWAAAGVVNGLSGDQQHFLENGGLGIVIGDGKLNYAPETIFETYYAYKVMRYATVSPDYQCIFHPGYNADRGPVNVFTARLHLEF